LSEIFVPFVPPLKIYVRGNSPQRRCSPGFRHTRESGYPGKFSAEQTWIPACGE
jgi:hypothetical protein